MEIEQFIHDSGFVLPRVGQIGIITADIQEALPGVAAAFNLRNWYKPKYAEKQFLINGEQVELDFNLVFAYSGGLQIELIEEKSHRAAVYQDHLDQRGQGIHHLGFYIPDMDEKRNKVEQMGTEILLESKFKTAGGGSVHFVYLDTRPQCGIILELINIKLYGFNVPQTEFMINVGRLTGDVLKLQV